MAQPFVLQISDNSTSVNFMNYPFYVLDGGFDISLPRVKRELVVERPGFYVPVITDYEYRECSLKFEIRGTTRSEIISYLHRISKIFKNIHSRSKLDTGRRGELSYAWEGATNVTYFEIYGGDIQFPGDLLSVAKIHLTADGKYVLPEVELTLFLSGPGYGVSIHSNTLTEIPIYNPSVGAKTTGGLIVENPWSGETGVTPYWWVEIDGDDIPGDFPAITRIELTNSNSGATYTNWGTLYMGLQAYPYPAASSLIFDDDDIDYDGTGGKGTPVTDTNANRDRYLNVQFSTTAYPPSYNPSYAWNLPSDLIGTFMSFMHVHAFGGYDGLSFATGLASALNTWGINYQQDWVTPALASQRSLALGAITLPPIGRELTSFGTIDPSLYLSLWIAANASTYVHLDYLSLLPITNGLRIWKNRVNDNVSAVTGTMKDDNWRGIQYLVKSGNLLTSPFYGILDPLKLDPGIDQRIYFTSLGYTSNIDLKEFRRSFSVRVYAVPTYLTLAM